MPQSSKRAKPDKKTDPAKPDPQPAPAPAASPEAAAASEALTFRKNRLLLFIALTALILLWTIHGKPRWPAVAAVILSAGAAVGLTLFFLPYLVDLEALKKEAQAKVRQQLGRPAWTRRLTAICVTAGLLHASLHTLVLEYDAATATAPRYELILFRGGRQVDEAPRVLSAREPIVTRRFLLLPWQSRKLEIAIREPAGYPKIEKKLQLLRSLALKVPSEIRCSECMIVRLVPRQRLFQELSSQDGGDAMVCCQIEIQGAGRAPLRNVLLQNAIYLGADEREVLHRLEKEKDRRTRLFDRFLQEDKVPEEFWKDYKRGWETVRVIPGWKLKEGESIVIKVTSAGPKPLRVLLEEQIRTADEFQTISLEINQP